MTKASFQMCRKRVDVRKYTMGDQNGNTEKGQQGGDPLTEDKVLFHPRELRCAWEMRRWVRKVIKSFLILAQQG